MKKIDVLIPLYNEASNIEALYKELLPVFAKLNKYSFSMLFVNDGSKDSSFEVVENLAKLDPRVKGISFSRNFGKELALTAGIRNTKADAVIIMDADLQHPPEIIPEFIKKWENGYDVVLSIRKYKEQPPIWKRMGSYFFNKIFTLISETESLQGASDYRLLDKKVVNALKQFTERNRLVRGLIDWVGFKRATVDYIARPRLSGEPGYSLVKLIRLAVNSFTSFSLLPLKLTGYMGILFFFVFGAVLLFMVVDKLTFNQYGFTNLAFVVVINSLSLGIVMIGLGLVALYIGHIYTESVNRPLYIVDRQANMENDEVKN